ncbi:MAG: hypothetical protein U5K75_03460 [Ahrensia sp.]|nr:hypothetical protein [Ahrensia sp.]
MALSTYLIGGAVVVAILVVAPFALPESKTVTRSGFVKASPEAVFEMIASTEQYQRFNPYHDTDATLKISPFGPAQGVGAGFAFEGKDGQGYIYGRCSGRRQVCHDAA